MKRNTVNSLHLFPLVIYFPPQVGSRLEIDSFVYLNNGAQTDTIKLIYKHKPGQCRTLEDLLNLSLTCSLVVEIKTLTPVGFLFNKSKTI